VKSATGCYSIIVVFTILYPSLGARAQASETHGGVGKIIIFCILSFRF
jgi:hypothetical protein